MHPSLRRLCRRHNMPTAPRRPYASLTTGLGAALVIGAVALGIAFWAALRAPAQGPAQGAVDASWEPILPPADTRDMLLRVPGSPAEALSDAVSLGADGRSEILAGEDPSKVAPPVEEVLADKDADHYLALRSVLHGRGLGGATIQVLCTEPADLMQLRADASGRVKVPVGQFITYYVETPGHAPRSLPAIVDPGGSDTEVLMTPYARVTGDLPRNRFPGARIALHALTKGQADSQAASTAPSTRVTPQGTWSLDRILVDPQEAKRRSSTSPSQAFDVVLEFEGYRRTIATGLEVSIGGQVHLPNPLVDEVEVTLQLTYPSGRRPGAGVKVTLERDDLAGPQSFALTTNEAGAVHIRSIQRGAWRCLAGLQLEARFGVDIGSEANQELILAGFGSISGQLRLPPPDTSDDSLLPRPLFSVEWAHGTEIRGGSTVIRVDDLLGFHFDLIPLGTEGTLRAINQRDRSQRSETAVAAASGDHGVVVPFKAPESTGMPIITIRSKQPAANK